MKPMKQLFKHNPPEAFGDCHRTCFACLLNMPSPDALSNWGEHHDDSASFYAARDAELAKHGVTTVCIPFAADLDMLLSSMKNTNPGVYYLLGGKSRNGTCHTVICLDDKIVHDPAIDNSGIVAPCDDGFYWVDLIVPLIMRAE